MMKLSKKIGLLALSLILTFTSSAFAEETFYNISKSSFKKYVWVNSEKYFKNPSIVCLEVETDSAIFIQYWDSDDNFDSSPMLVGSFWQCHQPRKNGKYRIKLVNANPNTTVKLKGGEIFYDK